jgi:hypothetical protein
MLRSNKAKPLMLAPLPRAMMLAGAAMLTLLAACQTSVVEPTTPSLPAPSPTATSLPTTTPTTSMPTDTVSPTPTPIPGFEGWSVFNPHAVEVTVENGTLILTLKQRALWFESEQGVLVYQPVTGNFKITADVRATKHSDPLRPPGDNGTVQLGGLMARNGNGGAENYVFIVVGNDGPGLAVETKTTVASQSQYQRSSWGSGEAALRLCRVTATVTVYKRHVGVTENWILAETYARPDLPETLQVGANIYTDNTPDLQVRYGNLKIEPVSADSECTTD